MKYFAQGVFWLGLYLMVSLLPLAVVFLGPQPPGRDFITEFSVALGFVGLAMLGLQFFLTARLRLMEAPYGQDIILEFHREISLAAFVIILAHPALLLWRDRSWELLFFWEQPARVWFALLSVFCLAAIIATSIWRKKFKLSYQTWRVLHGSLAIAALGFGLGHIIGVGHYISDLWQQVLWIGIAASSVILLLYIRIFKPLYQIHHRPYEVTQVRDEGGDVWTLQLAPRHDQEFSFDPGQFAWLSLGGSAFSIDEHPFSMSSSAARTDIVEFTIKALGDYTSRICAVRPGTPVYLDGPYGAFSCERYPAPGFVFVAGGIGITPIMSMLRTLADYGDTRPLLVFFAAKEREDLTFYDELESLRERLPYLEIVYTLENPPEPWEGAVGFVDKALLSDHLPDDVDRRQYFLCGPMPMMIAVERSLLSHGVPRTHIHAELFNLV